MGQTIYPVQGTRLNFTHGHTDDKIHVGINMPVDHFQMTPEEARQFIDALEQSLKQLAEHRLKKVAN